jgi:DUF1680 family protein
MKYRSIVAIAAAILAASMVALAQGKADKSSDIGLAPIETDQAIAEKFKPVELNQVQLTGLLGKHVNSVPGRLLEGQSDAYLAVYVDPVDTGGWRAEHLEKWLEAASNFELYSHDPKLKAQLDRVVDRLVSLQQPDG